MAGAKEVPELMRQQRGVEALRADVHVHRMVGRNRGARCVELVDHQRKVVVWRQVDTQARFDDRRDDRSGAEAEVVPLLAGVRKLEPVEDAELNVDATA